MPGKILQVNFKFNVPKADYEQAVTPLADKFAAVDGLAENVEDPAGHAIADRHVDGLSRIRQSRSAGKAARGRQGYTMDPLRVEMGDDFNGDVRVIRGQQLVVDLGHTARDTFR